MAACLALLRHAPLDWAAVADRSVHSTPRKNGRYGVLGFYVAPPAATATEGVWSALLVDLSTISTWVRWVVCYMRPKGHGSSERYAT